MYNININIQQGTIMRKWLNCLVKYLQFLSPYLHHNTDSDLPPTKGGVDKATLVRLN